MRSRSPQSRGLLTEAQQEILKRFHTLPDAQRFYLTGWLALALEKTQNFPDQLERWPVEMLQPVDPVKLKERFQDLSLEIMAKLQQKSD